MRFRYLLRPPEAGSWNSQGGGGVVSRGYQSYDNYLAHQRTKLSLLDLSAYDRDLTDGLEDRLAGRDLTGASVLCLAARVGGEVRAFLRLGAFAVGVDLEPGPRNEFVLPGDFHRLVFPDACVDLVYCNSLDHAFRLDAVVEEVRRVLRPGGTFLADLQQGSDAIGEFDDWAATQWERIDDVTKVITAGGFAVVRQTPITVPWPGMEVEFSR